MNQSNLLRLVNGLIIFCCIIHTNFVGNYVEAQKGSGGSQKKPTKVRVSTDSKWIQESLDTHNFYRSLHGSPNLVLNHTLSEISQYYANHLLQRALTDLGSGSTAIFFDHNPEIRSARLGENLFYFIGTPVVEREPTPSYYPVQLWYEEFKDYDYATSKRKPTSDPKAMIGHLTQLLWKSTTQMGTAYASSKLQNGNTIIFVVANYYPGGNVNTVELFLKNVPPPTISDSDINEAIVARNVKIWWQDSKKSPSSTPEEWRNDALELHNKFRQRHGSQPLKLNNDLCKVSQNWANYLLEKDFQSFNLQGVVHQIERNRKGTSLCKFGESSLFFTTGNDELSPDSPVKIWYEQRRNFNFDKLKPKEDTVKTDGFERIVWNTTTEFCISYARKMADNGQYLTYVVANYYPSQNWNERQQNIFKSKDEETGGCCSTGITILIIICVIVVLIILVAGSLFAMSKFKRSWYEAVVVKIVNK